MRCRGQKANGTPCQAPKRLVDRETGYCPSHAPGGSEHMAKIGKKGAEALRAKYQPGVDTDEWNLETHGDAKRWLSQIGKLVLAKKITHQQAQAACRCVETWLKAEGERLAAQVVEELKAEVDRIKAELGGRPKPRATP